MSSRVFIFAFLLGVTLYVEVGAVGGYGPPRFTNTAEKALARSFRHDAHRICKCGVFRKFEAIVIRSQVVAGTNDIMLVDVGAGKYIAIRIFVPPPDQGKAKLTAAVLMKGSDILEPELFSS